MSLVTASESDTGQTEFPVDKAGKMWSCRTWVLPSLLTRSLLEGSALQRDSRVEEGEKVNAKYPEYCFLDTKQESGSINCQP